MKWKILEHGKIFSLQLVQWNCSYFLAPVPPQGQANSVVFSFLIASLSSTCLVPMLSIEFYKPSQRTVIFRVYLFNKFLLSFSTLPLLLMQLILSGTVTRVPGSATGLKHKLKERHWACGVIFTVLVHLLQ